MDDFLNSLLCITMEDEVENKYTLEEITQIIAEEKAILRAELGMEF